VVSNEEEAQVGRLRRDQPREGSTMVGLGLELLFGRDSR
jgi:hypothetical protein